MFVKQIAIYLLPMLAIWSVFIWQRRRRTKSALRKLSESVATGLDQPASLHPVIDPVRCLGCGSCVSACPEGKIIGLISGKAQLIEASHCIGHGQCESACPVDAITLVFGTEKRGVDLPQLSKDFETNVRGIFIAGELGGMGLIKNATEQGIQAIKAIKQRLTQYPDKNSDTLDVLIVGAGPAGIAACLAAQKEGLNYQCIEQDSLGGTVAHFPRNKIVMTAPVDLPLVGKIKLKEISKEALLQMWQEIIGKTQLAIEFDQRLERVTKADNGFTAQSSRQTYATKTILLCLGRRGTPRKLDVPGETLDKVVYRLIDAGQYAGQRILVVGGGDSALEAALAVAAQPGTSVTLSYRGDGFSRAKLKNRQAVDSAVENGTLIVLLQSTVISIAVDSVTIQTSSNLAEFPNDAVIICAGGVLPTPFLKEMGIEIETKYGAL